jgi:hypothetical protein
MIDDKTLLVHLLVISVFVKANDFYNISVEPVYEFKDLGDRFRQ